MKSGIVFLIWFVVLLSLVAVVSPKAQDFGSYDYGRRLSTDTSTYQPPPVPPPSVQMPTEPPPRHFQDLMTDWYQRDTVRALRDQRRRY